MEPRFTPRMPPRPISAISVSSNTSMASLRSAAMAMARSAMSVAFRWSGGVLARSRARPTASPMAWPRALPAATAARCSAPAVRTTRSRPGLAGSDLKAEKRYVPSAKPSATACATAARDRPGASTSASAVASAACVPAARASAAAAVRSPPVVSLAGSPRPTATVDGPDAEGTVRVWPGLPSKPSSPRRARDRPRDRGTGPLAKTGTPTRSTSRGAEAATSMARVMGAPCRTRRPRLGGVGDGLVVEGRWRAPVGIGDRPGRAGLALLPAGHRPQQVGQPVEVGRRPATAAGRRRGRAARPGGRRRGPGRARPR